MRQFAEAAIVHAREVHSSAITLHHQALDTVDRILAAERRAGAPERGSLALCYGSWLGEVAVTELEGRWVGLHEPHPPRLAIGRSLCSPIEAVDRLLAGVDETSLTQRFAQLTEWRAEHDQQHHAVEQNREAWQQLAGDPGFAQVSMDDTMHCATHWDRDSALAAIDPWLAERSLNQPKLLCLAAGGGTHGLLHGMAGFDVTVVDFSERMLEIDRQLAQQCNIHMETLQASMDDLSGLADQSFDCVLQPVSTCYLPELDGLFAEVARVLRPRGMYISQHKHPVSLQASGRYDHGGYQLLHAAIGETTVTRDGSSSGGDSHLEAGTVEFIHSLEAILGGICRSGLTITAFEEPCRADRWAPVGSPAHRACFAPPYFKVKATKPPA